MQCYSLAQWAHGSMGAQATFHPNVMRVQYSFATPNKVGGIEKMNRFRPLAAVAACWILLAAAAAPIHAQESADANPASAKKIPLDTVLAKYDDQVLTLGEFFYHNKDGLRALYQAPEEARGNELKNFIQRTFFEFALLADAMKNGMATDPEYVSNKKIMESDYLSRLYTFKEFTQTFDPTDDELRELYEEVKEEKYYDPLSFSFRHIFFRTIDLPEDQQRQALENAKEAAGLIRGGSDFSTVTELYSDSERKADVIKKKSRKDAPEQAINPILEDALLALEPGEVSDIIKTKYGYEILELVSLQPANYKPLAQVATDLKAQLRQKQFEAWRKELIDRKWDAMVKNFKPDVIFDEDAERDAVVATIGSTPVTKFDFENSRPAGSAKQEGESESEYQERVVDAYKTGFIAQMLFSELARDKGYEQIPAFELLSRLYVVGKVQQVWFNKKAEKHFEKNPITEEMKIEFYEKNKQLFRKRPKVHLKEMTFHLPAYEPESKYEQFKADAAAKEKAQKAYERLQAGEDFSNVAREMSESDTAADGGDLGVIDSSTDLLPSTIVSRALKLGVNALPDGPQKYDKAYYLYTVVETLPDEFQPYDSDNVQKQINVRIKQMAQNLYYQSLRDEMVDPDKVELVYDDFWDMDPSHLEPLDYSLPEEN